MKRLLALVLTMALLFISPMVLQDGWLCCRSREYGSRPLPL